MSHDASDAGASDAAGASDGSAAGRVGESTRDADAPLADAALAGPAVNADTTVVAVGTSVTWCTGNKYGNKYPNLVHQDLNGGYPMEEKYLHFNDGAGSPSAAGEPTPSYYRKTVDDGYTGAGHPKGPQIPPVQYRARGGAIIGIQKPIRTEFGVNWSDVERNDNGGYLASGPDGDYDGKLDYADQYDHLFDPTDINASRWLVTRDIGWGWPTIPDQMEQFQRRGQQPNDLDVPTGKVRQFGRQKPENNPPDAEDVDVVLVDGGPNDLALSWLNNPTKSGRTEIWQGVKRHQYESMVGRNGLLRRARRRFPDAVIVLVGDPVFASNRTDHRKARKFLVEQNGWARILPGAVEQAIDNALNFSRFSSYWQRRAVAEEAVDDDGPGILYAPPGYGVVNSMMSDWPWSFGFDPNGGQPGWSVDDVRTIREAVCEAEMQREPSDGGSNDEVSRTPCVAAGIGHPNPEGCRQIADTVVRRYKRWLDRSAREVSEALGGSASRSTTHSLRRALGRYGFDPGNGVGHVASHRIVDSIRTKLWTGSGKGSGRQKGELYLRAHYGRNLGQEKFRLDTEYNDTKPGGPKQTPDGDYAEDEFHVDPMMGRRLDGPPGNTDGVEAGGVSKQNERNLQQYRTGDRWDDARLELGDVEFLTLELKGVDPDGGWDLNRARVVLNGWLERTRSFGGFDRDDIRCTGSDDTREFYLAGYNDVPGLDAGDIDVEIRKNTIDLFFEDGEARLKFDVLVENTASVETPTLAMETGMRVKNTFNGTYSGREWHVEPVYSLDPGEIERLSVELETTEGGNIRTNNNIDLVSRVFVGDRATGDTVRTDKKEIRS